ncbi:MAG: hypothetical protein HUJ58_04435 [Erysipelotrichaceae bacterium]|nr:hypothetical protein [Erysipelotrichaceae bacterium]
MTEDLFFDTDCLSAFLWIHDTNILEKLYGGRIILPEPVYTELSNPRVPQLKKRADALLAKKAAFIKGIDTKTEEYTLYRELLNGRSGNKAIGKGEAAGIALAKTYNGILASNNYRDIAVYVEKYGIRHIDTGMILKEALNKGIITETDGNVIWQKMLDRNRKLPAESFSDYLRSKE